MPVDYLHSGVVFVSEISYQAYVQLSMLWVLDLIFQTLSLLLGIEIEMYVAELSMMMIMVSMMMKRRNYPPV
jgi:hypothetical protein